MDKDGVGQQTALDPQAKRPVRPMRPLRIKAVVNAGAGITPAGKRADIAGSLEQAFARHEVQAEVELVQAEEFEAAMERAASGPWDAVAAGGGDGSIGSAARILARARKPMAVLPMGTWNYFARLLNIPLDINGAVAVMAAGRFGPVDAMEVNGRFFVSHCTLGIHPRFVRERIRLQHSRGWFKLPAMAWALLKSFVRYPVLLVEVLHEGRREVLRTPFVMAGNSLSALNPLTVPTHLASLSDGLLALALGRRLGRMGLMASALRTLRGRLDPERDFRLILVPECAVRMNRHRVRATLDGELTWLTPPLHFRILPHALTLLLPEGTAKSKDKQPSTGLHGPAA